METENRTARRQREALTLAQNLTPAELEVVAQYAYDTHGIVASPSYAAEAERAPEPTSSGTCPCGLEGCSDRPAYVAEYRAGLQVGAL